MKAGKDQLPMVSANERQHPLQKETAASPARSAGTESGVKGSTEELCNAAHKEAPCPSQETSGLG